MHKSKDKLLFVHWCTWGNPFILPVFRKMIDWHHHVAVLQHTGNFLGSKSSVSKICVLILIVSLQLKHCPAELWASPVEKDWESYLESWSFLPRKSHFVPLCYSFLCRGPLLWEGSEWLPCWPLHQVEGNFLRGFLWINKKHANSLYESLVWYFV